MTKKESRDARALLLLAAIAAGAAPLRAQAPAPPDPVASESVAASTATTAAEGLVAPGLLPSATEWGIAGGAILGGLLIDAPLRGIFGPPAADGARLGNILGHAHYVVPLTGITWAVGRLADQERVERFGRDATLGLAFSGVVNGLLKFGVGRARPHVRRGGELTDGGDLAFGSTSDAWQAFPSGHSVVAFSVATTISEEFDDPWVTVAAYGTATFVGWSRVEDRRHWASDVIGGAVVGILATRTARRWLHRRDAAGEEGWAPDFLVSPDEFAVRLPLP